jgi:ArsR family transcriptional regulator
MWRVVFSKFLALHTVRQYALSWVRNLGKESAMAKRKSTTKADLKEWARGFSLLSDVTRLGILSELSKSPRNVTAMCKALKLKQPTISHHLGLLRMGRLVNGERQGKSVVYTADKKALKELATAIGKLTPK